MLAHVKHTLFLACIVTLIAPAVGGEPAAGDISTNGSNTASGECFITTNHGWAQASGFSGDSQGTSASAKVLLPGFIGVASASDEDSASHASSSTASAQATLIGDVSLLPSAEFSATAGAESASGLCDLILQAPVALRLHEILGDAPSTLGCGRSTDAEPYAIDGDILLDPATLHFFVAAKDGLYDPVTMQTLTTETTGLVDLGMSFSAIGSEEHGGCSARIWST